MKAAGFLAEPPLGLDLASATVWTLAFSVCALAWVYFSRRGRK